MFRGSYQKGCFTVLYSKGSDPIKNWGCQTKNGYSKRIYDEDIKSIVYELMGSNVSTTFIYAPREKNCALGVKLPFLVLLIKNMNKYFAFEVKIIDDQRFTRRFKASNFQSKTAVKPFFTSMPMGLSHGWNQIHFNLADFTRRAYGTNYIETVRLQIHANIRIRRIYFSDRIYTEEELPREYHLIPKPLEKAEKYVNVKVPAARPPSPAKSAAETTATGDESEGAQSEGETEAPSEKVEMKPEPASGGETGGEEPKTDAEAQFYF